MDERELNALRRRDYTTLLRYVREDLNFTQLQGAKATLAPVVARARADGYLVASFTIPPIYDERQVGSTALQRLTGMVDVPDVDLEIPMLYDLYYGDDAPVKQARHRRECVGPSRGCERA